MGLIFTAYDEEFCKESFKDTNYGLLQQGFFLRNFEVTNPDFLTKKL